MALVGLLSTFTATVSAESGLGDEPVDPGLTVTEVISNLSVSPSVFNPATGENVTVDLDLSAAAEEVYVYVVDSASRNVGVLTDHLPSISGAEYTWYGTENNEVGGDALPNGVYTVKAFILTEGGDVIDFASATVRVASTISGIIKDFTLNPSGDWDPTDEDLEIEFELGEDVNDLTISAEKGSKTIEIIDDRFVDADEYTEFWDGTDDDGDYVAGGDWEIVIKADADEVRQTINVDYEKAEVVSAFVTKESFDPSQDEHTTLLFKADASAVVTVEVFDGSRRELKLEESMPVKKNNWYAVKWDGRDNDGELVDENRDWKFKVTAENPVEDDVFDAVTVAVNVEEDEVSTKKVNVTNDFAIPSIYDEDAESSITITYCLDGDAEVFVAVYDGTSITGKPEVELMDFVSQDEGCNDVQWDATDDRGKDLKNDVYSYKIISRSESGAKETEVGRFVVGDRGFGGDLVPVPPVDTDTGECGNYNDTEKLAGDEELCDAIAFVTKEGIFKGYDDGNFGPYNNITRAEVLKVVLEAFDVNLLPLDGTNQGFQDVNPHAWYMPYVRTAKLYGMIQGYTDGEAKLDRSVSRAELLKFALEASESFTGYKVPNYTTSFYSDVMQGEWYTDYAGVAYSFMLFKEYFDAATGRYSLHPNDAVKRGEAAKMLYRMSKNGLSNGWSSGNDAASFTETPFMY